MSWPEAQSYCRSKYTDLATVDSMGDVNSLINLVDAKYSGSVWIGLKRGTEKLWGWSNGEDTNSEYYNWDLVQPDEDGDCVATCSGVWTDLQCSLLQHFPCYKENITYLIQTNKNWSDAQSYCRQYYTDLPTIHNSEENDQISMLSPESCIWTGLFLDSWEWSEKRIHFFRHWAAGLPTQSSQSGDCVGMTRSNAGRWAQYSCDLRSPFICHGSPRSSVAPYQFVNESMTWMDALKYCKKSFTEMAAVINMSDVRRLLSSVDPEYSGSAWIGLYAPGVKRWIWSMGDKAVSQDGMWHPGEPNGDGECVRSFNGSWYDESCSSVLPFVCFSDSTGFIITESAMTWRDAQSYCRQHHTDLASISSPEQQNLIPNELSLWIGLLLDSWAWANQWNHYFRYWAADQPSMISGSGNCVDMSTTDSGKWANKFCDVQQPFICYGENKLYTKQVIRLKLSCKGECPLNDPALQTTILNEISKKLKSMGLGNDRKLSWRKEEGGENPAERICVSIMDGILFVLLLLSGWCGHV
ncbi:macrophage mannose receptor 1-like [Garra rufa]|uniref:macrophage mannose receptor 1-like n=1 Tax=Garra rufa TaxID=137080 RepID=UPI003CCE7755